MSRLDVCIETFFVDRPWQKRLEAIAALGYDQVEIWHPEATFDGIGLDTSAGKDPIELKDLATEHGLTVRGFVINGWDGAIGGCPLRKEDHSRFIEQVHRSVEFADASGVERAIIMPGVVDKELSAEQMLSNTLSAFGQAAEIAEKHAITLLVEPLNSKVDHPGFFLEYLEQGIDVVRRLGKPNVKLLYDIYHMQMMGGNILSNMEDNMDILGHVHVAAVPGRGEPDRGELNYTLIFAELARMGYDGAFGLEYFPREPHEASLKRQLKLEKGLGV
jgi:hydroxypyruvate isomerase